MSVAQQAKRGRKKARMDPRYCHKGNRDVRVQQKKLAERIARERRIQSGKKKA